VFGIQARHFDTTVPPLQGRWCKVRMVMAELFDPDGFKTEILVACLVCWFQPRLPIVLFDKSLSLAGKKLYHTKDLILVLSDSKNDNLTVNRDIIIMVGRANINSHFVDA
jgi:hypothetical protein